MLGQAIKNLQPYISTSNENTHILIKQLQALKEINISVTKVDIEESLSLLNQLIDSNERMVNPTLNPVQGD